jgi:hypothetical protein
MMLNINNQNEIEWTETTPLQFTPKTKCIWCGKSLSISLDVFTSKKTNKDGVAVQWGYHKKCKDEHK